MNPKLIGVIAGVTLALVLLGKDLMFWRHDEAEVLFKEAEAFYEDAKYESAIEKYNAVLDEASNKKNHKLYNEFCVLVKYKIALCYSDMAEREGPDGVANYNKAFETIKDMSSTLPKYQESITYLQGYVLYKQGKYPEAELKLIEFIGQFPNSQFVENALYAIGDINYSLKNYPKARQDLQSLLDKFSHSSYAADARFLIARTFEEENNFHKANEIFKELIEGKSNRAEEAHYRYAHNLMHMEENIESLRQYEDFVAKYPQSKFLAAAYFDMGDIYLKENKYAEARQHFDLALQNTSENDEIYQLMVPRAKLGIAYSCYNKGVLDEALRYLPDAKELKDDSQLQSKLNELRNNILNQQNLVEIWKNFKKKFDEGLSYSKAANKETDPKEKKRLLEKSVESYIDAIEYYKKEIKKDSTVGGTDEYIEKCQYNLTIAYASLGKWKEAKEAYNITDSEFQDLSYKQFLAAQSYLEEGKTWDAICAYKEGGTVSLNLAKLLYDTGRKAKASRFRAEAVKLYEEGNYKESAELYIESAKLYEEIIEEKDPRIDISRQLYNEEKYGEAAKSYREIVNSYNSNAEKKYQDTPKTNEAKSLYNEGKYAEAAKLYDEEAKGQLSEAAQIYEAFAASNVEHLYLAGVCYYQAGEPQKAIDVFNGVIGNPGNPYRLDAYYGKCLAVKDLAEKELSTWEEIGNIAKAAHKAFPTPNEEQKKILEDIDLLKVYAEQKKFLAGGIPARVKEQEEKIKSGSPEKARARQKIGDLYSGDKTFENKIVDAIFKSAIEAYNNLPELMAMYQTAAYYYDKQSYPDCVAAVNELFKQHPADTLEPQISARLYFMSGNSKYYTKDIAGAISDLEKAIERANQIPVDEVSNAQYTMSQQRLSKFDAYYQIGALYLKLRDVRQKEIGDGVDSEKSEYIRNAIDAFSKLGNYEDSYKALIDAGKREEAQNLMDKVVDAGATKAGLIADNGDLDRAIGELEGLQNSITPEYILSEDRKIQMQYTLGNLLYQRMIKSIEAGSNPREDGSDANRDARRAISFFTQIREQYRNIPNPPEKVVPFLRDSLFMLGMTYYQLKDGPNALNSFQYLVDSVGVLGDIQKDAKLQDFLQRALFQMAIIYQVAERYDDSIRRLEDLITRFPEAQDRPLWQYEIGNAKFAQAQTYESQPKRTAQEAINKYRLAKDAYETGFNPQHNIADDALWSIIVCWDNIKRLTADQNENDRITEREIKLRCERFDNEYRNSDYAPKAYIWLGAYYFNKGEHERALEYFRKAHDHPKAINSKIGNAKREAMQHIQTTVTPLIENNIFNAQNLRDRFDDIGALTSYSRAASLCLTLMTYFSNDSTVRTRVSGYIVDGFTMSVTVDGRTEQRPMVAIESAVAEIERLGIQNPLIQEIRNTIQQIQNLLQNPIRQTPEPQQPEGEMPGRQQDITPQPEERLHAPQTVQEPEVPISRNNHPLIYKAYELLVELYVIRGDDFANSGNYYTNAKENYKSAINTYNRISQ